MQLVPCTLAFTSSTPTNNKPSTSKGLFVASREEICCSLRSRSTRFLLPAESSVVNSWHSTLWNAVFLQFSPSVNQKRLPDGNLFCFAPEERFGFPFGQPLLRFLLPAESSVVNSWHSTLWNAVFLQFSPSVNQKRLPDGNLFCFAPEERFELPTWWLTATRSTTELLRTLF